jgi:hypothetical protein
MRTVIHRERRVELSFENKRLYDILRWRDAENVLNKPLHAMKISNTLPHDNSGVWADTVIELDSHPHVFYNRMYFSPVPQNIMSRNPKLVQNPGY